MKILTGINTQLQKIIKRRSKVYLFIINRKSDFKIKHPTKANKVAFGPNKDNKVGK